MANQEHTWEKPNAFRLPAGTIWETVHALMGKQYNKVIKRARRKAYKNRKKAAVQATISK